MRTVRIQVCCVIALMASASLANAQTNPANAFVFTARTPSGQPVGWSGGPAATLSVDSTTFRSAPLAGRIDRTAGSPGTFSTLTLKIPAAFSGKSIELRGWLRLQDVRDWAGLWLRVDGARTQVLAFDNMQRRRLSGTREWMQYTIRLPLHFGAREIFVGALLTGPGTIWVDDLELLVDGKPYREAAPKLSNPVDTVFMKGSGISVASLASHQIENLVLLGKVWGFVKYHHPRVTTGALNWDNELFRVLPQVLAANDRQTAVRAVDAWLAKIGGPDACRPCASAPSHAHLMPALDWIRDRNLGVLSDRLQKIYVNRPASGPQYYVSQAPNVQNPVFDAEVAYNFRPVPDAGYRVLALFRFWNIIEYWFPYRDVVQENWNGVLAEFLPRLVAADDSVAYRLELMRLSARIHDTHSNTWSDLGLRPPRGNAELPVIVRFISGRAVVTGYTHDTLGVASGLERGDVIERIGGQRVDSLVVAWVPFYSASNQPTRLRDMALFLTRGDTGLVRLHVERKGKRFEITARRVDRKQLNLARARVHDLPGEAFQLLSNEVAYIKISTLKRANVPEYIRRALGAKVLVIDLRNYPSDFPIFALGSHLVWLPTEFARFTVGDLANPGAFRFRETVKLMPATPQFMGKVAILVDEATQSSAEYHAMAFRSAPGAFVVGSTTAGADGNVSRIPLPGPSAGMISGIGVFYPDGRPTQRVGIIPDLEVRPTLEGIRAGRDEVLEAAVTRALGREWRMPFR